MKAQNFGHLVLQLHSFEIQRKYIIISGRSSTKVFCLVSLFAQKCVLILLKLPVLVGKIRYETEIDLDEKEPTQTHSADMFTSLLPPSSDHMVIYLGGYSYFVCTYSHAISGI